MNILVTGSKGQLGSEINALSPDFKEHDFFFTDRTDLDITSKQAIIDYVVKHNIEVIINCAAYTAVDKAESKPELANLINHIAVKHLAEVCKENKVKLIHISTDYVFDGKGHKPYPTDHPTQPVNKYGETKLKGELALKEIGPANSIIIRTSWVYSSFGNNFVKTMLGLGEEREEINVIADQIGTPTFAGDLAKTILEIFPRIKSEDVAVFHYTNEGICSWYDFAKAIFNYANINCEVIPITTGQYPTAAKRPPYSLMDKSEIKEKFKINIPDWKDSLKSSLRNFHTTLPAINH